MSDPKTTLLVLGAGCAAMIGVAAAAISAGSFFSDLPAARAEATAFQVPPRKVKTVAIVDTPAEKGPAVAPPADAAPTSSVTPALGERSALHRASPRWARNSTPTSGSLSQKQALLAAYTDDEANLNGIGQASANAASSLVQSDPFAMIVAPDENSEPTVELAGTVPHIPAPAPRDSVAREPADDNRPAPRVATTGRALSDTTTINEAANMRSAPRSGSRVLAVVPDGARVSIAPGCEQWCEISYNGRRGFVYKDFVGAGRVAARPRTKTQTVNADPLDSTIYGDSNFISSSKQSARSTEKSNADEKTASNAANADGKKQLFEPSSR